MGCARAGAPVPALIYLLHRREVVDEVAALGVGGRVRLRLRFRGRGRGRGRGVK